MLTYFYLFIVRTESFWKWHIILEIHIIMLFKNTENLQLHNQSQFYLKTFRSFPFRTSITMTLCKLTGLLKTSWAGFLRTEKKKKDQHYLAASCSMSSRTQVEEIPYKNYSDYSEHQRALILHLYSRESHNMTYTTASS